LINNLLDEKAANENRYQLLSKAAEPVDELQRYYSLMKTLVREIDAVQDFLQQARPGGRIRSGVEEIHRVEIFHFQQIHGDSISKYFSHPLFLFQTAKGEAASVTSRLIPERRSIRSSARPPVSPTNPDIPPSSPYDGGPGGTRSLSFYRPYAEKLEGASSDATRTPPPQRRTTPIHLIPDKSLTGVSDSTLTSRENTHEFDSSVTKTILPALDSSSREFEPRGPAVEHVNLAEDDLSDSEEVENAHSRDSISKPRSALRALSETTADDNSETTSDDDSPLVPPAAVPTRSLPAHLSDEDSQTSVPRRMKTLMATADGESYKFLDITTVESAEDLRRLISQTFSIPQSSCAIFRTEYGQSEHEQSLDNLRLTSILRSEAEAVGSVSIFVRGAGMSGVRQLGTDNEEDERPLDTHGTAISGAGSKDGDVSHHASAGAPVQLEELSDYLQKWTVLDVEEIRLGRRYCHRCQSRCLIHPNRHLTKACDR
jgi:hypothetical protein